MAALKLCKDSLEKCQLYTGAARDAVNVQQGNRVLLSQGSPFSEMAALPFTWEDLKILLKTSTEGQKAVRESLKEVKAAKAKAKPKSTPKAKAEASGHETDRKRKRGKTPA